jgi:hypothetical protein
VCIMKTIKTWFDIFLAVGSVLKHSGVMRGSVSEEKVKEICTAFQRGHSKSVHQASRELYHICSVSSCICLCTKCRLPRTEAVQQAKVTSDMLHQIDVDRGFFPSILFYGGAVFHQS